jgi:translation elongation factor EF-Tu-like GTPase
MARTHEGGRFNPFMSNYRPQLFIRTADVTVALTWPEGTPDAAEKMVRRFTVPAVFPHRPDIH